MGDTRRSFSPSIEPDMESLELFPSEVEGAETRVTSSRTARRVTALTDFPAEQRTDPPPASAPARKVQILTSSTTERPQDHDQPRRKPVARDGSTRPVLPPRRDGQSSGRSSWLSARLIASALMILPVATLIFLGTPLWPGGVANDVSSTIAAVPYDPPRVERSNEPASVSESATPEAATEPPAPAAAVFHMPSATVPQTPGQQEPSVPPLPSPRPAQARAVEQPQPSIEQNPLVTLAPMRSSGVAVDRPKFLGTLTIESQVAGAQIHIDGKLVGVTPLTDWQVAAGSHVVRVEHEGYSRWSSVVQVVSGKKVSLVAILQSIERD